MIEFKEIVYEIGDSNLKEFFIVEVLKDGDLYATMRSPFSLYRFQQDAEIAAEQYYHSHPEETVRVRRIVGKSDEFGLGKGPGLWQRGAIV